MRSYDSLRGSRRFSEVYRRGQRRRVGPVVVIRAPGPPGRPQVGFVAGRRVGNAVRRNRAKRRLREAMARVPLHDGMSYVVIAGPEVVDAPFGRLVEWLAEAIRPMVSSDRPNGSDG